MHVPKRINKEKKEGEEQEPDHMRKQWIYSINIMQRMQQRENESISMCADAGNMDRRKGYTSIEWNGKVLFKQNIY